MEDSASLAAKQRNALGIACDFGDSLRLETCPSLDSIDHLIEYHGNIGCYHCYLNVPDATMSYLQTFASQLCVDIDGNIATLTLHGSEWKLALPHALHAQSSMQIESDHIYLRLSLQQKEPRSEVGISTLSRTTLEELDPENYKNIHCRLCNYKINNCHTNFDKVCPLPSDNWLEMQEFWGAGHGAFQHLSRDTISARKCRVFIADAHILLHTDDLSISSTDSDDIKCQQCGSLLGRHTEDTALLYKYSIFTASSNIFSSYHVDSIVCVSILETIETEGLFQFRLCAINSALSFKLRVLSWELRLLSSDTPHFNHVLKVVFEEECVRQSADGKTVDLDRFREVQVEVYVAGDGVNYPQKGQTVAIHYTGYLEDGQKYDSTRDREKPLRFKLGEEQVIPGLEEGVERLCMNERAKIYIPSYKAYGSKGFPGLIPPDSNLIFDVELVGFR
ncbi:unnamed protein product [Albugo candida]|uniref:peptidylprolyl isomerase n=1 Tax=Albugo candida TaxID=65357 RepID=A0A024G7Z4_9STRA|nr:unnamed protein product [Albugo candida]|eukprot:CCI42416.1 unnamed protein product [Albugo candida]